MSMAASLTYYALFSLAPIFLCLVAIGGMLYSGDVIRNEILFTVEHYVGFQSATIVDNMMDTMSGGRFSAASAIVGLAVLVYAATTLFVQVQRAILKIFALSQDELGFLRDMIVRRTIALIFLIALTLFLFGLVVMNVFIALFSEITQNFMSEVLSLITLHLLNFFFTFFIVSLLCAVVYRIFGFGRIDWGKALIGGSVAALFFIIINYLLGLYVQLAEVDVIYGFAGAIIVMLLWIYYMINVFLFGAYVARRKSEPQSTQGGVYTIT